MFDHPEAAAPEASGCLAAVTTICRWSGFFSPRMGAGLADAYGVAVCSNCAAEKPGISLRIPPGTAGYLGSLSASQTGERLFVQRVAAGGSML